MAVRYRVSEAKANIGAGVRIKTGLKVTAFDGRKKVGAINAAKIGSHYEVGQANVLSSHQRSGVGSELYRRLSEQACSEGRPLRSYDFGRNRLSTSFWQKMERKGAAVKREGYYEMSCPVPSTLRGRR